MYDKHILCDDSLRATPDGWSVEVRLPYYRGQPFSVVEDIALSLDGQAVERGDVRFSVRGGRWTLDQLASETIQRWEFGERAVVSVVGKAPPAPGPHEVSAKVQLRISYLPWSATTGCTKTLQLAR